VPTAQSAVRLLKNTPSALPPCLRALRL
jgi:hypothetical protein